MNKAAQNDMHCFPFKTTRCEFLTTRKKLKYPTTGLRKNPEVIEDRYDLHLFRSRRRETRRIIGASRSLQSRRRKAAEYDAFGKPYTGNFDNGIGNGYTGKPYDTVTGLYNYGYRDYSPTVARFTTVDPIRDGNNWFSYVKNDPVNYVDLWGLEEIWFYETTKTLVTPGATKSGTTTTYSQDRESVVKRREKDRSDLLNSPSTLQPRKNEQNTITQRLSGTSSIITKFGEVLEGNRQPNSFAPPAPGKGVTSILGTANDNGISCKN